MPYLANSIYDQTFSSTDLGSDSGLFGLGEDIVALPLKAIDIRFKVDGVIADVCINQIFEYEGDHATDVKYQFPLPAGAAVYKCDMKLGDKVISAIVKPEKDAEEIYQDQKKKGHRVGKVESVRENLFNLKLGNVQPGDTPVISFAYVQTVESIGLQRQLRIPTCQGVRFIPGIPEAIDGATDLVPDAGKLITTRISKDDPEAAVIYCNGTIGGVQNVTSSSHTISVNNEEHVTHILLGDESTVPNSDMVLQWNQTLGNELLIDKENQLGLLTMIAPNYPKVETRDIHFLIDSSGSMQGENWDSSMKALQKVLSSLSKSIKVSFTLFSNDIEEVLPNPTEIGSLNIKSLFKEINKRAQFGGTVFSPAFKYTINKIKSNSENPALVIITDGQFADEAAASKLAADAGIEIHAFGIDRCVNDDALGSIARRAKGSYIYKQPGEDLEDAVCVLSGRLSYVSLKAVTLNGIKLDSLPRAYPGDTLIVPFQLEPDLIEEEEIDLNIDLANGASVIAEYTKLNFEGNALSKIYSKDQIQSLLDNGEEEKAIELSCESNITCRGTTFIAYNDEEKISVAESELTQPALEPASYSRSRSSLMFSKVAMNSERSCSSNEIIMYDACSFGEFEDAFEDDIPFGGGYVSSAPEPSKKILTENFSPLPDEPDYIEENAKKLKLVRDKVDAEFISEEHYNSLLKRISNVTDLAKSLIKIQDFLRNYPELNNLTEYYFNDYDEAMVFMAALDNSKHSLQRYNRDGYKWVVFKR